MKSLLRLTVSRIVRQKQRRVKKYLFGLCLTYAMLVGALSRVSVVPIETLDLFEMVHLCILL